MGNQNAKKGGPALFTPEELKILEVNFRAVAHFGSEKASEDQISKKVKSNLQQAWSTWIDPPLAQSTANYLLKIAGSSIPLKSYAEPYYIVERGTYDEKVKFLVACLEKIDANQFSLKDLENYVASVVRSFMLVLQTNAAFESWKKHGYQSTERTVISFAKNITRSLAKDGEYRVDVDQLEHWLNLNPMFLILWREVFAYLYSRNVGKHARLGREVSTHIIPVMEGLKSGTNYTPILDLPHVIFLNSNLPNEFRHKWRFMFSSKIMGESFSTMLGNIMNKGPTLIIVEDEDRYVFAGYAPASWTLSPLFVGDETSTLFTLSPAMRCFSATGYNDHYQYLNLNQQTMPNGLGMGGQFNFWGLWLDCEYGLGQSSESCTTYRDYIQLSKRKEFRIRNLEVFAIGDEPKHDDDDDENQHKSVLDRNLEDRVILELSGKQMHSEGLREPDMDL